MIAYLLQLNWHSMWQSAVLIIAAGVIVATLRDTDTEDRSFHRMICWGIAALSPLFIVPFMIAASYSGWDYTLLLVWRWLLLSSGTALDYPIAEPSTETSTLEAPDILIVVYVCWLISYGARLLRDLIQGWQWIRVANRYSLTSGEEQVFIEVCTQLKCKRPPVLLTSDQARSPHTYGCWCPVIILPGPDSSPIRSLRDFKAIVAHEVTHIKYRHNIVPLLYRIVVWLFPLSWVFLRIAYRKLEDEMELFADAVAVKHGGAAEKTLKQLLGGYAKASFPELKLSPGCGFVSVVVQRLRRPLGKPLFARQPFITRIPLLVTMLGTVNHVNIIIPSLTFAAPLATAKLVHSVVPSIHSVTDTAIGSGESYVTYPVFARCYSTNTGRAYRGTCSSSVSYSSNNPFSVK